MTRACYALTLLLVALGGALLVTSPARCQVSPDYGRCGSCYHAICPCVDGYIETHEEVIQPAQTDETTDEVDLRGRAVVAILDVPVAIDARNSEVVATDEQVDVAPADGAEIAPAAESEVANIRSSSDNVESVNSTDAATDVYNYGYRYEYMSQHGYYGQRHPEYYDANVGLNAAATPAESTTSQEVEEVVSHDAGPTEKPYDAYDYIHHYDRAYEAACPSGVPDAAAEVAIDAVESDPEPVVARDYENEVYQAYLQRCAEEAVAQALVVEPADQVYEPYEAEAESSYDVYDYDNGYEPAAPTDTPVTEESAPCEPSSYGRHPYGYGYEYDYEYHKEYGMSDQAAESTESAAIDADSQLDVDVLQLVDLGREFLGSVVDLDLVDTVRAEAEHVLAQVAQVVKTMEFERIRHDATQALVATVQQPVPEPSDWDEADVFLFMFDSDLNAEPVAAAEVDKTPWMVESQIVEEQPQDEQDTAIVEPASDETDSAPLPMDRDQVIQWTRRAIDTVTAAWDRLAVVLQHFASRSLATVPSDDPSSTTQR